jgi:NAD(P)-dependent dehydrogenase (short-subunit alcohol dehydrogenase family)
MADPFDFTGRKALITGGSRGIGLAVARAFADRGCAVALTGRKAESLEAAAAELRSRNVSAHGLVCHQGDPAAVEGLFARLDEMDFVPDIVVINAATNPAYGPLLECDLAAWQKILDVNLTGAMVTAREAARRMKASGRGSLIFMASLAGIDPMPGLGPYSVSKAGMIGLTKALARELGPAGVRVNALAPGLVETRFAQALFENEQAYRQIMGQVPLGRHAQPDDIAGAAVFLASEASGHITGQVIVIDGGSRM